MEARRHTEGSIPISQVKASRVYCLLTASIGVLLQLTLESPHPEAVHVRLTEAVFGRLCNHLSLNLGGYTHAVRSGYILPMLQYTRN